MPRATGRVKCDLTCTREIHGHLHEWSKKGAKVEQQRGSRGKKWGGVSVGEGASCYVVYV